MTIAPKSRIAATIQLGMDPATAQKRLQKIILFNLVCRLNQDICFVCGFKIQTVEEFSIEHKIPWLYASPDLFWDLENITFSHLKCNRPHRYRWGPRRPAPPDGQNWCGHCENCFPYEDFCRSKNGRNGRDKFCRSCKKCIRMRKKGYVCPH